ncbi:hypothetical protein [Desulfovibrio subterraneus]|uniref:Uncharacterized protein n=1 Tax=Desulfovibrio subterraneus TaxID=2718620 RepID=A0A7J0BKM0_9BACT|nr:hypothetical protein [Desulfovibrio subterraneus]GFM34220.1 hypothetical protein DSM101010T_25850 [Desulfovibrio subterraneus]
MDTNHTEELQNIISKSKTYDITKHNNNELSNEDKIKRDIIINFGKTAELNIDNHKQIIELFPQIYNSLIISLDSKEKSHNLYSPTNKQFVIELEKSDYIIGLMSIISEIRIYIAQESVLSELILIEYVKNNNIITKSNILTNYNSKIFDIKTLILNIKKHNTTSINEFITKFKNELTEEYEAISTKLKNESVSANEIISEFKLIKDQNYELLADAFEKLKNSKSKEKTTSLFITIAIAMLLAIATCTSAIKGQATLNAATENGSIWSNIPYSILILDMLLIYFFRISLQNYYTARDEYIQIEIRSALCRFVQVFTKFADSTHGSLDEFSRHIFSPLHSKTYSAPHPIDFLATITTAAKNCTSKSDKQDTDK